MQIFFVIFYEFIMLQTLLDTSKYSIAFYLTDKYLNSNKIVLQIQNVYRYSYCIIFAVAK